MIQVLMIALAVGVFLHDADPAARAATVMHGGRLLGVVLAPMLVLALAARWACRQALRQISRKRIRRAELVLAACRFLLLPWYAAMLATGTLRWVRGRLFDVVLLDELLVMLPVLAVLAWTWWCYYPIDRRLREAALIGRLDRGLTVYPVWTRTQYLIAQLRHQVLLIFAPLLLILAWAEAATTYLPADDVETVSLIVLAGAAVIFLLSPLIIRFVFDTVPLPPGEVRDRLRHLCDVHGVRVRELLLWRTFGGMINAAVMGVIAPLRYVMLTDALLDSFPREQVEAVMAHELAHVRKHHMFWLLAFAFVAAAACDTALGWIAPAPAGWDATLITAGVAAALAWVAAFGWASRRIERQADAFAAAHLARQRAAEVIDADAAGTMIAALQRVADLNHTGAAQRSWRHGSIRSRQDALRRLVGQPLRRHSADRAVRTVKLTTLLAAVALTVLHLTR